MAKMKKSEDGISLRKGQYKRLGRIAERNPERADKVAERMKKRDSRLQRGKEIANPRRMEMMKNALMKEKELKERELNAPAKKAQNGKKTAFGMLSVKKGIDNNPNPNYGPTIPFYLFFFFQLKFAAITPALIIGSCVERIKLISLSIFMNIWSIIVYCPIAHWMWNQNGWAMKNGILDFAGGLFLFTFLTNIF
jgi:hypothetical protein